LIPMKRYVIANWKCHKTGDDARQWFDEFAALYEPQKGVAIIVAPSYICLENLAAHLRDLNLENVHLAAQDISPFPRGGYTGAVAADMVKNLVEYVIIGHSERRRYFHETWQDVINKVTEVADADLIPIICVEQPSAHTQLSALHDIDLKELVVAYSPVDSLTFRIPESPEKVEEAIEHFRQALGNWPMVYGGALLPGNVEDYLCLPSLAGVFVGASSLDAAKFAAIVRKAQSPGSTII
jgi:triosephosphate isomerase